MKIYSRNWVNEKVVMPDAKRSALMASVRQKNTAPELIVRKLFYSLGLRFRLHRRDLPGSPDIVLSSRKVAVFVHGCFWHRHPRCSQASSPKSNCDFCNEKFQRNIARDKNAERRLKILGWRVLIIWECETRNKERLMRRLDRFFFERR